jgi:3-hydroxyacyl-CoA dehydrogenase
LRKRCEHSIRRTRSIVFSADDKAKNRGGVEARALKVPKGGAPAAIDGVEAALTLDFDAGSLRERELFADCVVSDESKALRHLFFAEREASKCRTLRRRPRPRHQARAVVGAGTMGGGSR